MRIAAKWGRNVECSRQMPKDDKVKRKKITGTISGQFAKQK